MKLIIIKRIFGNSYPKILVVVISHFDTNLSLIHIFETQIKCYTYIPAHTSFIYPVLIMIIISALYFNFVYVFYSS